MNTLVSVVAGTVTVAVVTAVFAYTTYAVFVILQEQGKHFAEVRRRRRTARLMSDPYKTTLDNINRLERELGVSNDQRDD